MPSLGAGDGRVCVLLAHDGRGCRPQDLPRVFSQGFMERQIGFDLHFCAIAIEEMEGRLEVHSDGENQGMQFEILLPTAEG
ncbi:ATP-binding protein [Sulfidibacter corallicola]|uniref:ATP-binding protein n=1 Tax=Sulfidibacter corallicola TaxID=2818388 RepID=UPI003075CECA